MSSIYRKSSLHRFSSPDHLDKLMSLRSPKIWIMLVGGIIMLVSLITWSIVGKVVNTISSTGVYKDEAGGKYVVCYMLLKDMYMIQNNLKSFIVPMTQNNNQKVVGKVVETNLINVTYDEMKNRIKNDEIISYIKEKYNNELISEVIIELTEDEDKVNNNVLCNGQLVHIDIVVQEQSPINIFMKNFVK